MGQIQAVDLVAPGSRGLNTENANSLLSPGWATTAINAVINRNGRIGARKGWASQTTTNISGNDQIDVLFEYLQEDGTSIIITAADNAIYQGIDDYTVGANDITSSTTPTADHWQFVNFNGKVLGFQRSHTPIEWSGTGDFTDASYTGTGPDGNCALAAFGRVWACDADLQTIRVSVLLDDTDYSSGNGGGTLDMSSIWTRGMDQVVAIASIGAQLVVFGRNHIVIWEDNSGSEIGVTLANLEIADIIEGTGCIARDSVVATGEGDLIYLSRNGLQSLARVIQEKNNPVNTLTRNVRANIIEAIAQQRASDANFDQVRAVHSPEQGLYIINFPVIDKQFVLDTQHPFLDDDQVPVFPVTEWFLGGPVVGMLVTDDGSLYFGAQGEVGLYSTNRDDATSYGFQYQSGWLDFGELNHRLKLLKEIVGFLQISSGTVSWTWEFDFSGSIQSRSVTYDASGAAQYNIAQYNVDQYSGGLLLQRKTLPAHGEGQFIRVGLTAQIDGFDMVVQQLSLSPKIGREIS